MSEDYLELSVPCDVTDEVFDLSSLSHHSRKCTKFHQREGWSRNIVDKLQGSVCLAGDSKYVVKEISK